jgi:hypothetical protein
MHHPHRTLGVEAAMSYYQAQDAQLLQRPSLGWRILLLLAAVVPVLVTVFVIFLFIRSYVSPPMVVGAPATLAARGDMVIQRSPDETAAAALLSTPAAPTPPPSPPPQRVVTVPQTRAPAFAPAEPAPQPATGPAAATTAPVAPPTAAWPPTAVAAREPALSPADAIEARSAPLRSVPLPQRRPVVATADLSDVPLPRSRPPLAADASAPLPDTSSERPDRNF